MNMNFTAAELEELNKTEDITAEPETVSEAETTAAEAAAEKPQTTTLQTVSEAETTAAEAAAEKPQTTTLQTMTVDQSIYAIVEPGTGPLLRSSTTDDNAKLFNALNGSSESVKNWLGEEIDVTDIVITSADVPSIMGDEDSERVCKPCVHFFTLDGTHISSISNGIVKSTKMLLACGLTPSEERPIRIRFKEVETKKGTAHTFEMV